MTMHVQIKSEKADNYCAGGYVFPPPQVQQQLNLAYIPGQTLNVGNRMPPRQLIMPNINNGPVPATNTPVQTIPENKDMPKISEDQVDFSSIKGIFGWTLIDNIHVPCIFRHEKKYVSVRIVEHKLLSRYPNSYPDELGKHAPLTSFFITQNEAKLLNEINTVHCDGEFGQKQFTTKDLIVLLTDFEVFFGLVKKTFPENKTVTPIPSHSNQQNSETKDDLSKLSNYCGWFQINNTVSPYIRRVDDKYIPLSVIRYAAGLLIDIQVTGVLLSLAECELLNKTCKVAGFDFCFSKTTRVIALSEVTRHCSVHIRDLPFESPLTHAQYMDLPSPVTEQRPTPPPTQCYTSQGGMGMLQNMPPQINNALIQMQGRSNEKMPNYEGFPQRTNMPVNPSMYNQRMFMYNRPPWMHNNTVSPPNVALNPQTNMRVPNMSCGPVNGQFQVQNMNTMQMNRPSAQTKNPLQRNTGGNNIHMNNNQNGWQGAHHRYPNPAARLDNINQSANKLPVSNSNAISHSSVTGSNMLTQSLSKDIQNQRHNQYSGRLPVTSSGPQSLPASQTAQLPVTTSIHPAFPASQTLSVAAEQHHGTSKTLQHPPTRNHTAPTQYSVNQSHNNTGSSVLTSVSRVQVPTMVPAQKNVYISNPQSSSVPSEQQISKPSNQNTMNTLLQQTPQSSVPSPGNQGSKPEQPRGSPDVRVSSVQSPPVMPNPQVEKVDDSSNSKVHPSQHSVAVQQLKDAIIGVWLGGKSISCLCLDLPARSGQFCLVEAVCKLYFSGCSVEEFQYALASVLKVSLVTCTEDEEKAFILYYSLPVKELKCNKMIGFEELQSFFPQLNYMFKDKKSTDSQDKKISDTDQVGEKEVLVDCIDTPVQPVSLEEEQAQESNYEKPGNKRPCSDSSLNSPPAKQANRSLEDLVQKLKNQQEPIADEPSAHVPPASHDDVIVLD